MEVWWGEEQVGDRAGVQVGWDTVRWLQEHDNEDAVSFRMSDAGRPAGEEPLIPLGDKCGETARQIRLTVYRLPADMVRYLVLVQAYLEQGRAKGDKAGCQGLVVTRGRKAWTDNTWVVYREVQEVNVDAQMRTYAIRLHTVYCHYPREVVHIPEPKDGRVLVFLVRFGIEGQPRKAEAAEVQVRGVGQATEVIVDILACIKMGGAVARDRSREK